VILLSSLLLLASASFKNPWGTLPAPIPAEESQIYGSYSAGCIANAEKLPLSGFGYEVVNSYRNRHYAHTSLVQFIHRLSLWSESNKLGKVVVGDLAQPAGGPLAGDHLSHQIGLDADIRLHLLPPEQTIKNRNNFNSTDVTRCALKDKKDIQYTFFHDKWPLTSTQLLQKAAQDETVERIFVSAAIKKHLCEIFPDKPSWLKKIRPEWGHTSHFHVRLQCPPGMKNCEAQPAITTDASDSTNVGCSGVDYQSWFKNTKNYKKVSASCIPQSDTNPNSFDSIPRWKKVLESSRFPQQCRDLLLSKTKKSITL
jgi:penicillin-insensitive murein DD-endopeptidase